MSSSSLLPSVVKMVAFCDSTGGTAPVSSGSNVLAVRCEAGGPSPIHPPPAGVQMLSQSSPVMPTGATLCCASPSSWNTPTSWTDEKLLAVMNNATETAASMDTSTKPRLRRLLLGPMMRVIEFPPLREYVDRSERIGRTREGRHRALGARVREALASEVPTRTCHEHHLRWPY